MAGYGVKIKYANGKSKIVESPHGKTFLHAESYKILLMTKTQEEDTEYYIVPLEKNRKGKA